MRWIRREECLCWYPCLWSDHSIARIKTQAANHHYHRFQSECFLFFFGQSIIQSQSSLCQCLGKIQQGQQIHVKCLTRRFWHPKIFQTLITRNDCFASTLLIVLTTKKATKPAATKKGWSSRYQEGQAGKKLALSPVATSPTQWPSMKLLSLRSGMYSRG